MRMEKEKWRPCWLIALTITTNNQRRHNSSSCCLRVHNRRKRPRPLHELLSDGLHELIAKVTESELAAFLADYRKKYIENRRHTMAHNGYLVERTA